jgi:transposase
MATTERVVIGMDPHKRSVTIEVMAADEEVLGGRRFGTDVAGFNAMSEFVTQWPNRVWAIEGCSGIGRHVAMRLIVDGEEVIDVPPRLSARARVFSTGQGRKTDATDAHSVALVGTRMTGLRPVVADDQLAVLRMLADRRRSLGEEHTRKVSQLHALLLELLPGGAKKDLSAAQAKALLAKVRPRDQVGKTRRRLAAELVGDLEQIYARKKAADKELRALVAATGTGLMNLHGIGPSGAARLLVEVGDITRFPDRNHFASWTGTAPIDASSGDVVRHRLSRGGNRQINRTLHIMATVQLRNASEVRAYFDRKKDGGKSSNEAMRCLKRRLSDLVFRTMLDDVAARGVSEKVTARVGTGATTLTPARPAHSPEPTLRKSHTGARQEPSLSPHSLLRLDTEGSHERSDRD